MIDNVKSEIFLMDCLEGMKQYPDNHFDLAVVDPPYGINAAKMSMGSAPNRKGEGQYPAVSTASKLRGRLNTGSGKLKNRMLNKSAFDWDNEKPSAEYFEQLFRVSKNQVIWGGNYFELPPTRGVAVWNKLQPWENLSQCEIAWTSFDVPAKLISLSNTGGANKEVKIHPTQKPVALYDWVFAKYAQAGQTILDTHLGSGSSRIAAQKAGLQFTGFELAPGYFQDSQKRYQQFISQLRIF